MLAEALLRHHEFQRGNHRMSGKSSRMCFMNGETWRRRAGLRSANKPHLSHDVSSSFSSSSTSSTSASSSSRLEEHHLKLGGRWSSIHSAHTLSASAEEQPANRAAVFASPIGSATRGVSFSCKLAPPTLDVWLCAASSSSPYRLCPLASPLISSPIQTLPSHRGSAFL